MRDIDKLKDLSKMSNFDQMKSQNQWLYLAMAATFPNGRAAEKIAQQLNCLLPRS